MATLVQKDSKNRVHLGSEIESTHFTREIDDRGRIILTPQVLVSQDEYEEKFIVLSDEQREVFVQAMLSPPARSAAFNKAQNEFRKKYK